MGYMMAIVDAPGEAGRGMHQPRQFQAALHDANKSQATRGMTTDVFPAKSRLPKVSIASMLPEQTNIGYHSKENHIWP